MSWAELLENEGWTRRIAGDADFDAAVSAIGKMRETGKGLIVSGEYGVGKTSLLKIIDRHIQGGTFFVNLLDPYQVVKLTPEWQDFNGERPWEENVFLDDLGAEKAVNNYGIVNEPAADFILNWICHRDEGTRLLVSTNFRTQEVDNRYGGRLLSRLKDYCIPLRLNGKDKREWSL